jgi:hypothetical protein
VLNPPRLSAWSSSFLEAPALCWCARTMVLSIMAYSLSASAAKCSNSRSHTLVFAQRLNRGAYFSNHHRQVDLVRTVNYHGGARITSRCFEYN